MKKEMPSEEITRIIERENVITFKRKNQQKSSLKSQKEEEEEVESAKSNPFNEEAAPNKAAKRNMPLPELNRERKRLIPRNIVPEAKTQSTSTYLQKEVRQHDNIMLKNANNHLTNENIRLKTKNMNLQKEVIRLQKLIEEDPQKSKNVSKDIKFRGADNSSIKMILKNLQKELDDVKKENTKIKTSIKFTTISEVEVERDNILEESKRLREMLEEEHNKLNFLKAYGMCYFSNQQGLSAMEQRMYQLQEKNNFLMRENNELKGKIAKPEEKDKNSTKFIENEKNLNRLLLNARRILKEKEKQVQILKGELKKSSLKVQSLKVLETSSNLDNSRNKDVKSELSNKTEKNQQKFKINKEKRMMSKSAQKYRSSMTTQEKLDQCLNCQKLKEQNAFLNKQIENLKADIQQLKNNKLPIGELSKNPLKIPNKQELEQVRRFLVHRFKAHHLTLQQAIFHLINIDGKLDNLEVEMSVSEVLQILMAEPFSLLSDRYIQSFITQIFYKELLSSPKKEETFLIDQTKKIKRKTIEENFRELVGPFELINQNREEEMFIQIAELVTQYQQHILKALNDKRNSENTINQVDFYSFFEEIELEKEYIDFMISQIILQSLDLDHLNIYNLFEIFYMPAQEIVEPVGKHGKPKYNMIETVVKEEDEEYEESKSFMDSRQKTISKHEDELEHEHQQQTPKNDSHVQKEENEEYDQHFEQQKTEKSSIKQKAQVKQALQEQSPQNYHIENADEEYNDDYQT